MTVAMQQLILAMQRLTDTFHESLYRKGDLDAALAVLDEEATLEVVPVTGGPLAGDALRRHLAEDLLPHLPADLTFRRLSRVADVRKLVDEQAVAFTHDRELPWLLPGVAPTDRRVEVLAISVISFRHRTRGSVTESVISAHRTLWDHSSLAGRLGPGRVDHVTRP
jgi:carboxymethylenebutenolidase